MDPRRWLWPAVVAGVLSGLALIWWLHWFDFVDAEVYRAGAGALLHGHDIYRAHPRSSPLPFTYPPFAAVVFVPLAVLPDVVARVTISALSVGALVVAVAGAVRLACPGRTWPSRWTITIAICAVAPWLEPVRDTLRFGQINLVLMALVLTDFAGRPQSRWRGVATGIATAIKLTPGIFILYLLVTHRSRQAFTALAAAGLATGCAFILMPAASARYWAQLIFDDSRIGSPGFVWNQSLRGAVARLAGSPDAGRLVWLPAGAAVLVAGLVVAARAHRSGDPLLGVALAAVAGLLVSPISWDHHWVWAVPVAIALWYRGARLVAAGWAVVFFAASTAWWALPGDHDHLGVLQNLAADGYVLAALLLLAFLAWAGRPPGPGPAGARRLTPAGTESPLALVDRGRERP